MVNFPRTREYEIIREGGEEVLVVNANYWPYSPSIEGNPLVMVKVVDYLAEVPSISRIVLNQKRNFNYSHGQTHMLAEVARVYSHLTRQKKLLGQFAHVSGSSWYATLQYVIFNLLRSDPISAYVELKRLIREEGIRVVSITDNVQAAY